jgi:uncharacterized membrane protein
LEGREQRAKAKKSKREEMNPLYGMFSLIFVFAALILIPVLIFFYNMMQDPITPTLIKNMTGIIKERTFGFLSTKKNDRKAERSD